MQAKLTELMLQSLKPPAAGRLEISDMRCRGLAFRLTPNAIATWVFRYRDRQGNSARETIGRYPDVGLSAARAKADKMRERVADGESPVERSGDTFVVVAARYVEEYALRNKRSGGRDARNLALHVLPRWKDRPLSAIRRADVIELVESIVASGKPTLANRIQSLVSGVFSYALDAGIGKIESNPCYRLRRRGVENVGRRVLSDAELRLFWHGIISSTGVTKRIGLGLQLALLTGARIGEIAGIRLDELQHIDDANRAAWIISGARTKRHRNDKPAPDHLIPLAPPARGIVLALVEMAGPGEQYLFPTRSTRRRGAMRANSFTQALDGFNCRMAGNTAAERTWKAAPPTPHDLRRTVGTRLAELRVQKEIRDRVLNHAAGDVGSKHYNVHDYADEKREALTRWSDSINVIIGGIW
jgi:integrase